MPGRSFNGGDYRYGFNGMEKDDEIKGSENSYTTYYRGYDPRLGRWFSTDPKMKAMLSSYQAFRNSPLLYVDPNGDDDFFDRKGKYLGSTKEGNDIRIVNSGENFDRAQENVIACASLLAEIDYNPKNLENRSMLAAVATFYGNKAGLDQNVEVGEHDPDTQGPVGAYWHTKEEKYFISVSKQTGLINKNLSNAANLENTWTHEKTHKEDKNTHSNINHVNSILTQVKHSSFSKTTIDFKVGALLYATNLLNRAIKEGASMEDVNKQIDAINNSKLGDTGFLIYDEESKSIIPSISMGEVEVKSE